MSDADLRATKPSPGIYLEDHPPQQTQFRARRSDKGPLRPVIVVHTAENMMDLSGPDTGAENVARYISDRTSYGSYHFLTDRDSVVQLVRLEDAAFGDGTGSNEWAVHISCAVRAKDWLTMDAGTSWHYYYNLASAAVWSAMWFYRAGFSYPEARILTNEESEDPNASGFISHGRRDPARRSDPGAHFDWKRFFTIYTTLLANEARAANAQATAAAVLTGNPATAAIPRPEDIELAVRLGQVEVGLSEVAGRVDSIESRLDGLADAFEEFAKRLRS